ALAKEKSPATSKSPKDSVKPESPAGGKRSKQPSLSPLTAAACGQQYAAISLSGARMSPSVSGVSATRAGPHRAVRRHRSPQRPKQQAASVHAPEYFPQAIQQEADRVVTPTASVTIKPPERSILKKSSGLGSSLRLALASKEVRQAPRSRRLQEVAGLQEVAAESRFDPSRCVACLRAAATFCGSIRLGNENSCFSCFAIAAIQILADFSLWTPVWHPWPSASGGSLAFGTPNPLSCHRKRSWAASWSGFISAFAELSAQAGQQRKLAPWNSAAATIKRWPPRAAASFQFLRAGFVQLQLASAWLSRANSWRERSSVLLGTGSQLQPLLDLLLPKRATPQTAPAENSRAKLTRLQRLLLRELARDSLATLATRRWSSAACWSRCCTSTWAGSPTSRDFIRPSLTSFVRLVAGLPAGSPLSEHVVRCVFEHYYCQYYPLSKIRTELSSGNPARLTGAESASPRLALTKHGFLAHRINYASLLRQLIGYARMPGTPAPTRDLLLPLEIGAAGRLQAAADCGRDRRRRTAMKMWRIKIWKPLWTLHSLTWTSAMPLEETAAATGSAATSASVNLSAAVSPAPPQDASGSVEAGRKSAKKRPKSARRSRRPSRPMRTTIRPRRSRIKRRKSATTRPTNLVRMPGTERTTRQFDETQLPPKKRLRSDRQTPAGSPAANSLGQQLVQETLVGLGLGPSWTCRELAALERKRQRLLFELATERGKKCTNGSSPPQQRKSTTAVPAVAESTGAEERALLSTLARSPCCWPSKTRQ
uniref:Reverse transcriptase domain-containing protein n=1 Tax=Macrostomum lignano TaxID=282301 RepID=A0A1I8F4N3_9PLAT